MKTYKDWAGFYAFLTIVFAAVMLLSTEPLGPAVAALTTVFLSHFYLLRSDIEKLKEEIKCLRDKN